MIKLRIAVRDWDYLTPLALGDVVSPLIDLQLDRVATLPASLGGEAGYHAAETSFSRYLSGIAADGMTCFGIPNFLMRGFRHQCIITAKNSPLTTIEDLAGKRIGVTGWQDSGNIWTRAILRQAGLMTDDVRWYAGRLTASHPIVDRLAGFGQPGRIEPTPNDTPLLQLLSMGQLDAVFTPFMPSDFFSPASEFRLLLTDCSAAQQAYFEKMKYVPGIHMLTLELEMAHKHPWLAKELSRLIDTSRAMWTQKRQRYADTTPFMLPHMYKMAMTLSETWDSSELEANRTMIEDFASEIYEQNILKRQISVDEIFPTYSGT